jgi:hypothetical protein
VSAIPLQATFVCLAALWGIPAVGFFLALSQFQVHHGAEQDRFLFISFRSWCSPAFVEDRWSKSIDC